MSEIVGAIERIDDPQMLGVRQFCLVDAVNIFFGQKLMPSGKRRGS